MDNPGPKPQARALRVGKTLNLKRISTGPRVAANPLTVEVAGGGVAVLFRFGVVVFFEVDAIGEAAFLAGLEGFVEEEPVTTQALEVLDLRLDEQSAPSLDPPHFVVPDLSIQRCQAIAEVLAKSLLLEEYERRVAEAFDGVEPLAEALRVSGTRTGNIGDPLRHIGEILLIQQQMVGRAEVGEKPELLWEYPELERTYGILTREYDIKERLLALERKLEVLGTTAETLLDLLQNRRTLRVEWYIVILIVVEIVLTLYELFIHG